MARRRVVPQAQQQQQQQPPVPQDDVPDDVPQGPQQQQQQENQEQGQPAGRLRINTAGAAAEYLNDLRPHDYYDPRARLGKHPKTLYYLWTKYLHGNEGGKAAKDLTPAEEGQCKSSYCKRNAYWREMVKLINMGHTEVTAIDLLQKCYGQSELVCEWYDERSHQGQDYWLSSRLEDLRLACLYFSAKKDTCRCLKKKPTSLNIRATNCWHIC